MAISIQYGQSVSDPKEKAQLGIIYNIINSFPGHLGDGYLFGSICVGDVEFDALLLTTKYVLGIEFKNYGGDGTSIQVTSNQWNVLDRNGVPVKDADGNDLVVKGGSGGKTPLQQAQINHSKLFRHFEEALVKQYGISIDLQQHSLSYVVVFNKEISEIDTKSCSVSFPGWLRVVDNDHFAGVLAELSKMDSTYKDKGGKYIHLSADKLEYYIKYLGTCITNYKDPFESAKYFFGEGQYNKVIGLLKGDVSPKALELTLRSAILLYENASFFDREDALNRVTGIYGDNINSLPKGYYHYIKAVKSREEPDKKRLELYKEAYKSLALPEIGEKIKHLEKSIEIARKIEIKEKEEREKRLIEEGLDELYVSHNTRLKVMLTFLLYAVIVYTIACILSAAPFGMEKLVVWGEYIKFGTLIFICISVCVSAIISDSSVENLSRWMPWYREYAPMMAKEALRLYDSKVQMVICKAVSLVLLLLTVVVFCFGLSKLIGVSFLDKDAGIYALLKTYLTYLNIFFRAAAIAVVYFWGVHYIIRIKEDGDESYVFGVNPGFKLIKYYFQKCKYLLRVSATVAMFFTAPIVVNNIKEYIEDKKQERQEKADAWKKELEKKKRRGTASLQL